MIVFGLIGAKGAGKTTAFKIMKELNPEIVEITLAKKLKETCANIFELPFEIFDDPKLKEKTLDIPIYLSRDSIEAILISFGQVLNFNAYIRHHIGKIFTTPRKAMQYIGTEILRSIDENIHCEQASENINGKKSAVVTDIRFPSEAKFFQKNYNDFLMLYIKNTHAEMAAQVDNHASERHLETLKKGALIIENETSIDAFEKNIKSTLKIFLDSKGV
jgi:hypothetical protein